MSEFNVNDYVWVRLTPRGRTLLAAYWAQFAIPGWTPPALEETDGWSKFQLWNLMGVFGEHLYNGCDVPFETTIRFSAPAPAASPTPPTGRCTTTGPRRTGIAELEQRLGVHRATITRWIRAGRFPVPHYIGERRAWFVGEVEAWEARRMADQAVNRRGTRNLRPECLDSPYPHVCTPPAASPTPPEWTCRCGYMNNTVICTKCGAASPTGDARPGTKRCACGHTHHCDTDGSPDPVCDEWGEEDADCSCTDFAPPAPPAATTTTKEK